MKDTDKTCEQEIKRLLRENPQAAVILAIEQYTGLVWSICGRYLTNPEDQKECVNDTFAEFYWQRERFDETKGSLAAFLGGIAKHRAISYYRRNKRYEMDELPQKLSGQKEEWEWAEDRLDLEAAINGLKTEDSKIIRMKYYGGMTVQEIADSLNLPYETVKKRHQRTLGKLKLLLLVVLILLLTAGLAACAYFALRHFRVIPGYGINRSEEMPFYVLGDTSVFENEQIYAKLESGVMSEDSLILNLYVEQREIKEFDFSNPMLIMSDQTVYSELKMTTQSPANIEQPDGKQRIELVFEPTTELARKEYKEEISMVLRISEIEIPFTFRRAKERELEAYSYAVDSQGGILAIPQLKDGRLYVDLYPLNCGDYITDPGLVRNIYEDAGGHKEEVTATGEDGVVRTGKCLQYSPFSNHSFYRWDFGLAEEGEYLIHIPYVYQTVALPKEFQFTVSDTKQGIGQRFSIPGGCLTISGYSKKQPEGTEFQNCGDQEEENLRRFLLFDVETEESDRILAGIEWELDVDKKPDGNIHFSSISPLWKQQEDYVSYFGHTVQLPKGYETGPWTVSAKRQTGLITYRWNHSFSISIRVEAEK